MMMKQRSLSRGPYFILSLDIFVLLRVPKQSKQKINFFNLKMAAIKFKMNLNFND